MVALFKCSFDSLACLLRDLGSHSISFTVPGGNLLEWARSSSSCCYCVSSSHFASCSLSYPLILVLLSIFYFFPSSFSFYMKHTVMWCNVTPVSYLFFFNVFGWFPLSDWLLERHRQTGAGPEWKRSVQWQLRDGKPHCRRDDHHGNVPLRTNCLVCSYLEMKWGSLSAGVHSPRRGCEVNEKWRTQRKKAWRKWPGEQDQGGHMEKRKEGGWILVWQRGRKFQISPLWD